MSTPKQDEDDADYVVVQQLVAGHYGGRTLLIERRMAMEECFRRGFTCGQTAERTGLTLRTVHIHHSRLVKQGKLEATFQSRSRPRVETVRLFEELNPPQGFRMAAVALELGMTRKSLSETLTQQGYILKPLGGRGPNARKHLTGCYNFRRPGQ